MSEQVVLDVPENHKHYWFPIKHYSENGCKVRCLRCGLEAMQVKGKIYRTLKELDINLRAGE